MKKLNKYSALLLLIFLAFQSVMLSQEPLPSSITDTSGTYQKRKNLRVKNPEGTEFWLCFEKNYKDSKKQSSSSELQLELFITGDENANVNIEIEGIGYKQKVFVPGGKIQNVKIPPEAQVKSEEIVERLALHITSDKMISVYGLNRRFQTTDTYLGLPTTVLGTEYRAMCYTVSEGLMPQFAVIATDDNTEVVITPSVATSLHPAKKPFTIYLRKGDVYQVVARNEPGTDCDLTGSLIKANKKIALFSGHQCAYVTPKIIACNHLVEQIPPLPSWGKHFYLGIFQTRSKYTYRVLANESGTKVFQDNQLIKTLREGEFFDSTVSSDIQITANKPILVAQFSQGFKNGDSIGDPMMLLISPTQQFLQQYRFATPINGYWKHCINVVVPTKGISSMKLDGEKLDPRLFKTLGISRYSIAYINIPFGSHFIEGDLPFGMYSYGFGYDKDSYDAYGTMGGQSFIEYEPANDTIPPNVDDISSGNSLTLILRDDRVDDSGIKGVNVLDIVGLKIDIPQYDEGAPQLMTIIKPTQSGVGRMLVEIKDMALNKVVYTICYAMDEKLQRYTYTVTEGIVENCNPDPGFQFGVFGKLSSVYHSADFSSTGNLITEGRFESIFGMGGYFGLSISRRIKSNWAASARLSLENYGGTFEAADTLLRHVRTKSGELKPFQESSLFSLSGTYFNLGLAGEYYLRHGLYLLGGFNLAFNLSSSIDYKRKILQPADYTYLDGTRETTPVNAPAELNSLNSVLFSMFAGAGYNYSFNYTYTGFSEVGFNHFFSNAINDGDWKINQLSLLIGLKIRF